MSGPLERACPLAALGRPDVQQRTRRVPVARTTPDRQRRRPAKPRVVYQHYITLRRMNDVVSLGRHAEPPLRRDTASDCIHTLPRAAANSRRRLPGEMRREEKPDKCARSRSTTPWQATRGASDLVVIYGAVRASRSAPRLPMS
jgi:hypothetical protein